MTAGLSARAVDRELNGLLSTISRLRRCFREFGSTSNCRPHVTTPVHGLYIQHLHLQDHLCPAILTAAETIFSINNFCQKPSENISGKLICMLVILIRVSTCLQFITVTDFSWQMFTFDGIWYFREVFSSQVNLAYICAGQVANCG